MCTMYTIVKWTKMFHDEQENKHKNYWYNKNMQAKIYTYLTL